TRAAPPGRVDSPPTSTQSAPSAKRASPAATAASASANRPPSEKESGVTLTTPITSVRPPNSTSAPRSGIRYRPREARLSVELLLGRRLGRGHGRRKDARLALALVHLALPRGRRRLGDRLHLERLSRHELPELRRVEHL